MGKSFVRWELDREKSKRKLSFISHRNRESSMRLLNTVRFVGACHWDHRNATRKFLGDFQDIKLRKFYDLFTAISTTTGRHTTFTFSPTKQPQTIPVTGPMKRRKETRMKSLRIYNRSLFSCRSAMVSWPPNEQQINSCVTASEIVAVQTYALHINMEISSRVLASVHPFFRVHMVFTSYFQIKQQNGSQEFTEQRNDQHLGLVPILMSISIGNVLQGKDTRHAMRSEVKEHPKERFCLRQFHGYNNRLRIMRMAWTWWRRAANRI